MYDKLDFIQEKYEELSLKVSDPDVIADQANWQKYAKELGEMEPIVQKYTEYKKAVEGIQEAKDILADGSSDEEMRELAKMELSDLEESKEKLDLWDTLGRYYIDSELMEFYDCDTKNLIFCNLTNSPIYVTIYESSAAMLCMPNTAKIASRKVKEK